MDRSDRLANAALIYCGYLLAIPLSLRYRRLVGGFPADWAGVDWLAAIFPFHGPKTFATSGVTNGHCKQIVLSFFLENTGNQFCKNAILFDLLVSQYLCQIEAVLAQSKVEN